ncbi:DUF1826 domain-containing protein [uncultured Microscilla sp.]|uniref:DUF1826 domain-containing protein n=1 Tax=uncultured Microscilla sp. TaxID=432653 RepID=UPI002619B7A9|nr:DUF1826 domain-containing protein [uncultured Microscilla sp.]
MITKNLAKDHFLYTKNWDTLTEIQAPHRNLAILERTISVELQNFLYLLQKETQVPVIQETLPVNRLKQILNNYLQQFRMLDTRGYQALIEDIYQLVWQFSQLVQQSHIKLYFAKIETSMCRLFHTDANELRLLCTYWGAGTQWVDNDNIHPRFCGASSNAERIKDLSKVLSVKTYDVAILKGALHDHIATNAIMHRSPPLDKNQCRLLLRLDTEVNL